MDKKDGIFRSYSQSSCEYECKVNQARDECRCTPWNVPTPPNLQNPAICDLYGNHCFHLNMIDAHVIENCIEACLGIIQILHQQRGGWVANC